MKMILVLQPDITSFILACMDKIVSLISVVGVPKKALGIEAIKCAP